MQEIFIPKWFFCCYIIILQIYQMEAPEAQNQEAIEKAIMNTVDWPGLLSDLRDSWQSPLSYLQKRGYLPPGNENLLEQKLNELRAMKLNEHKEDANCDELGEKSDGNIEMESSFASAAAGGNNANGFLQPNVLSLQSSETAAQSTGEYFNPKDAIVTYASRQQQPQETIEDLIKQFSLDEQGNSEQVNSDTELDSECKEDSDSLKNNIPNSCGKKAHSGGSKSKLKHRCKNKFKSKSKPGFFQRLKQKLSSIFTKSKEGDSTKQLVMKPALTTDYANYFVKYLAHRDVTTGSNTLSVNDINDQYAGIKSFEDYETGGKGLFERDHGAKDLSFGDNNSKDSIVSNLNKKYTKRKSFTSDNFESTGPGNVAAGSKDFMLKEFPFKDFNLADLNEKRLKTKDTTGQQEEAKISDLKNFSSQNEELNKIVHSLAEQESPAKESLDIKNEKFEPKVDSKLKESSIAKASGSALQENSNSLQKDFKDFSLKHLVPSFDDKNVGNAGKNTERVSFKELLPKFNDKNVGNADKDTELGSLKDFAPTFDAGKNAEVDPSKELSSKDDCMGNLEMPNFSAKNSVTGTKDYTNMRVDLSNFDFSTLPDLGAKSMTSISKDAASKGASANYFGNLGMPSLKMKILESNAAEAAAAAENEYDSDRASIARFDIKSPNIISNEGNFNDFELRQLEAPKVATKFNDEVANHVAIKQANLKHFGIGELASKLDEDNLDLDRQFTRQVLEKVMRSSAENRARDND